MNQSSEAASKRGNSLACLVTLGVMFLIGAGLLMVSVRFGMGAMILIGSLFFVVAFWALIWPMYPLFGGARPLILGMPLSLVYVAGWLVASFLVLLTLYLLEERR